MTAPFAYALGERGDDLYATLLALHEGLSRDESGALNARLVLSLMNAVGDADRVLAAFEAAADVTPAAAEG